MQIPHEVDLLLDKHCLFRRGRPVWTADDLCQTHPFFATRSPGRRRGEPPAPLYRRRPVERRRSIQKQRELILQAGEYFCICRFTLPVAHLNIFYILFVYT